MLDWLVLSTLKAAQRGVDSDDGLIAVLALFFTSGYEKAVEVRGLSASELDVEVKDQARYQYRLWGTVLKGLTEYELMALRERAAATVDAAATIFQTPDDYTISDRTGDKADEALHKLFEVAANLLNTVQAREPRALGGCRYDPKQQMVLIDRNAPIFTVTPLPELKKMTLSHGRGDHADSTD